MFKRMIKALSKLGSIQINSVSVNNNSIASVSTSSGDVFIGNGCSRWSGVRGNRNLVTNERTCEKFDKIRVTGPVNVKFVKSDQFFVKVTAESNIQDMIKTKVAGHALVIGVEGAISPKRKILVECSSQWLKEVYLFGAGKVNIDFFAGKSLVLYVEGSGEVNAAGEFDDVTARLEGSGDIKIDPLIAESIDLIIEGSGNIFVDGRCSTLTAEVMGSGDIRCGRLEANSAYLSVKGSGDIDAWCKDKLTAKVKGSGDISVKGSPERVNQSVRGSGDIEIS